MKMPNSSLKAKASALPFFKPSSRRSRKPQGSSSSQVARVKAIFACIGGSATKSLARSSYPSRSHSYS